MTAEQRWDHCFSHWPKIMEQFFRDESSGSGSVATNRRQLPRHALGIWWPGPKSEHLHGHMGAPSRLRLYIPARRHILRRAFVDEAGRPLLGCVWPWKGRLYQKRHWRILECPSSYRGHLLLAYPGCSNCRNSSIQRGPGWYAWNATIPEHSPIRGTERSRKRRGMGGWSGEWWQLASQLCPYQPVNRA